MQAKTLFKSAPDNSDADAGAGGKRLYRGASHRAGFFGTCLAGALRDRGVAFTKDAGAWARTCTGERPGGWRRATILPLEFHCNGFFTCRRLRGLRVEAGRAQMGWGCAFARPSARHLDR